MPESCSEWIGVAGAYAFTVPGLMELRRKFRLAFLVVRNEMTTEAQNAAHGRVLLNSWQTKFLVNISTFWSSLSTAGSNRRGRRDVQQDNSGITKCRSCFYSTFGRRAASCMASVH